jgi:outer membrane protein OmpA-like peptidoglycan-associated protein
MRTALALSAVLLAGGCASSAPPEDRSSTVVPIAPQAGAGEPVLQETTDFAAPVHYVDPSNMRGILYASNHAVHSNGVLRSRPNLYEDPAEYRAWLASQRTATGATTPPTSATAAAARHLVYFDWNEATLTPEGRQVIGEIARHARSDAAAQIVIVGKADLSGTDAYNMGLSQRRADTVRRQLVADGTSADRIDVRWVGDRDPPVPTAKGVREARNRVVEMTTTTMVGSTAPPGSVVVARRVLWTTTEDQVPGGRVLPGVMPNGSVSGAFGN